MKNLKVSDYNHQRVMRLGNKLQSVDDIIGMLLDEHEKKRREMKQK